MRRVITGILSCLLVILLMSHNTFAVSPVINMSLVRLGASPSVQWSNDGGTGCRTGSGSLYSVSGSCSMRGAIITLPYSEYLAGDIIEVDFNIIQTGNDNANNSWVHQLKADSTNLANTPVAIIDIQYENLNQNTAAVKVYIMVGAYTNSMPTVGVSGNITLNQNDFLHIPYTATWRIAGNGSAEIVNAINNSTTDLSSVEGKIDDVVSAIEDLQESNQDYQEAEQQAVENIENQTTSDTQSELPDMSSATSLIGNIQNIFVQIGNIPAGNCTIPANWGNLNLGNLNLCTGKENMPFVVTFGAYAFELIFVIGASIILVKQVVSMFDWARGDN